MKLSYQDYIKFNAYNIYLALNSIVYYCIWFLCLFYVIKHNFSYYLQLALLLNLIQYLVYLFLSDHKIKFTAFVLIITVFAVIIDSIFYNLGYIKFYKNIFESFSPIWIILMWNNFAITFYITSQYFFNKPKILAILAFIFVPLAYFYVSFFQAIYVYNYLVFLGYGIIWAILLPLLCYIFLVAKKN